MNSVTASVITPLHVHNYGSVLQAYATVVLLESFGLQTELVNYVRPDLVDPVAWTVSQSKYVRGPISAALYKPRVSGFISMRARVFEDFIGNELPLTRPYHSLRELVDDPPSADIHVTGSDQAWNTSYNVGGTEPYLLSYLPSGARKVSLATSFGKSSLSTGEETFFRLRLGDYRWLSVREESARRILSGLGVESEVIPDPTLLLRPDDWLEFGSKLQPRAPYVLIYCLNRRGPFAKKASCILKGLGIRPVVVRTGPLPRIFPRVPEVLATPREYVGLIAGATHVITDSFHGTAFSINMGVPVSVIMPPRYSTRLDSLLTRLDAENLVESHPEFSATSAYETVIAAGKLLNHERAAARAALRSNFLRVLASEQ